MATTKAFLSDVLCTEESGAPSHQTCPPSPILAGKDASDDNSLLDATPAGILSPKASSSPLNASMKRTRAPVSSKRPRPESRDEDYSPVSSPKRRRIVSARLPTPSVSRRSSMNFTSSACNATASIPRSFADIESALAPITDLASEEEEKPEEILSGGFEKLSTELRDMIFSRLDYKSLISLSQTNRLLHQSVNPQAASFEDKFSFVMQAENYFARHWPGVVNGQEHPGNFACYVCFRVRNPSQFDDEQSETVCIRDDPNAPFQLCSQKSHSPPNCAYQESHSHTEESTSNNEISNTCAQKPTTPVFKTKMVTLRRYCVDCGVLHGLHKSGDVITTKLRQQMWICDCRRVHQSIERNCSECNAPCPAKLKKSTSS